LTGNLEKIKEALDKAVSEDVPSFMVEDIDSYLAEKKQLFLGIGLCITEWSTVDFQLLRLTCDALGTGSQRTAVVYLSTGMISKRIELVSELVETIIFEINRDDEDDNPKKKGKKDRSILLQDWDCIIKELRDIVPFRNKLAHWKLGASRPDGKASFRPALSVGIPDIYRAKLKLSQLLDPIYSDDIVEHYARLKAIVGKINAFGPAFAKAATQLPKPSRTLSWLWKPAS
jgi:hypothetical protein